MKAIALTLLLLAGGSNLAEARTWDVRTMPGSDGGEALTFASVFAGEDITAGCQSGNAAFVAMLNTDIGAVGFRAGGTYRVDNGRPRDLQWVVTGNIAVLPAPYASRMMAEIAGADRLELSIGDVQRSLDLTALKPQAGLIARHCGQASRER